MMAPVKSVTAVMAVIDVVKDSESAEENKNEKTDLKNSNCNQKEIENQKTFSNTNNKCLRCSKTDCEFRQK